MVQARARGRQPHQPRVAGGPLGRRHGPRQPWSARRAALRGALGRVLGVGQRVVVVVLALVVLIAFVSGIAELRWKERVLRAEVDARTTQLRAADARNEELRGRLAATNPDAYRAYVEDTARRQLNLGYPDETVVLVGWSGPAGTTSPPEPPAATPVPPLARSSSPWERLRHALFGE